MLNIIQMHTLIINYLEKSNYKEANNIMRLTVASHALMTVLSNYFSVMDMIVSKFLIKCGFLDEENVEAIVIYLNYITTSVTNYMNLQLARNVKAKNSDNKQSGAARENYRNMKKWYALVDNLQKETIPLIYLESTTKLPVEESMASCSTIPTEIL